MRGMRRSAPGAYGRNGPHARAARRDFILFHFKGKRKKRKSRRVTSRDFWYWLVGIVWPIGA